MTMEALRRIVNLDSLRDLIDIPSNFTYQKVEILILPLDIQSMTNREIFESDNSLPASQTRRSILELRGLGKQVWQNVSVKDYINAERDSWNG